MITKENFNSMIPYEMRKGESTQNLFDGFSEFFNFFLSEMSIQTNTSILNTLSGKKLDRYGARYGVNRNSLSDQRYRRRILFETYIYKPYLSMIDNFTLRMTEVTGYKAEVDKSEITGRIDAIIKAPPGETLDLLLDVDKYWIYGCEVNAALLLVRSRGQEDTGDPTGVDELTFDFKGAEV